MWCKPQLEYCLFMWDLKPFDGIKTLLVELIRPFIYKTPSPYKFCMHLLVSKYEISMVQSQFMKWKSVKILKADLLQSIKLIEILVQLLENCGNFQYMFVYDLSNDSHKNSTFYIIPPRKIPFTTKFPKIRHSWLSIARNKKCHSQPKHNKTTLESIQRSSLIRRRSEHSRGWRGLRRYQCGWSWSTWNIAGHIDVNLLSSLAVTRYATEIEVVTTSGDSNGVISSGISGQRGWCITWLVHCMRYSHHVVKLCIVLKIWYKINNNKKCYILLQSYVFRH